MTDDLGDRMKHYESIEAARQALPLLPICIRLDGKGFSKWTAGLRRPYDERLSRLMVETTKFLLFNTCAKIGYTQSDEISLVLHSNNYKSDLWFDGKLQKITSVAASMCTATFNELAVSTLGADYPGLALFDCRVWTVPNKTEAANTLLWRERDATKNAISMAARCSYSHKELHEKTGSQMQEMLFQKGTNFNDFPAFFKRGTFVQSKLRMKELTEDELAKIPEPYRTEKRGTKYARNVVEELDMPPFDKVTNRVAVVFDKADPESRVERLEDSDWEKTND